MRLWSRVKSSRPARDWRYPAALAMLGVVIAFVLFAWGNWTNARSLGAESHVLVGQNETLQARLDELAAINQCRNDVNVAVDVTKGNFLLAEGDYLFAQGKVNQIFNTALLSLSDRDAVARAVADAAAANAAAVTAADKAHAAGDAYKQALDRRERTNAPDVCGPPVSTITNGK